MANFFVRRLTGDCSPRFFLLPALILTGAALLAGCHPAAVAVSDPKDPKFIVAEKGTWQITRAELDTQVTSFLQQHQATPEQVGPSKMPMVETMMLKNMVLKKLMLDKAATLPLADVAKEEAAQLDTIKQSIPPGQDFDAQLKAHNLTLDALKQQIHEQVVIHKVLEAEAFKNVDPTEQQIDQIYLTNKDSFNIPEKVRASRILILVDDKTSPADKATAQKTIAAARARVAKGEDFGKVAADVSQDQYSKAKGGDLGFFAKGENPDAGFDDVAFNTKVNVLSPVFLTPLGYQFIKVTAIQPPGVVPVADARGYISQKLKEQNMQAQSQAYAKKLLADSNVTYHLVLVDPPAQAGPGPDGAGGPPPGGEAGPDGSGPPPAPDSAQQAPPAEAAPSPSPAPAPAPAPAPNQ
jgi:parvulin-like peptidyl-prolyl isomerase